MPSLKNATRTGQSIQNSLKRNQLTINVIFGRCFCIPEYGVFILYDFTLPLKKLKLENIRIQECKLYYAD